MLKKNRGFSLIEILVVVAIIGLLVAILIPSLSRVRQQSRRAVCMSNLKQIGVGILNYRQANKDLFPVACGIPEPFIVSLSDDPPLFEALRREIPSSSEVYACPGDAGYVHARCQISYVYESRLSGKRAEDNPLHKDLGQRVEELPVAYDFDGLTADLQTSQLSIPFFHIRRNLLFSGGHVGDYKE